MKHVTMKLRIFDYLAIVFTLAIILLLAINVYGNSGEARFVTIEASGTSYVYMLDKDQTIQVPGPLGKTTVRIADSEVFVTDSPCRDKLCIKAPPLKKAGEWNACMPNKVFIRITGNHDTSLDSLSY